MYVFKAIVAIAAAGFASQEAGGGFVTAVPIMETDLAETGVRVRGGLKHFQRIKNDSSYVDLSSEALFQDQVHFATNQSIAVQEEAETELFFLIGVAAAIVADQAFNDGGVTKAVAEEVLAPIAKELAGFFAEVLGPIIADIFNAIGQFVYDILDLAVVDEMAKELVVKGPAKLLDIVGEVLGDAFEDIKKAWEGIKDLIGIIKDGLEAIGALDFIDKLMGSGRRSDVSLISNQPHFLSSEEFIEVTDGNGNVGYLSSSDQDLLMGGGGLEELQEVLKSNSILPKVEALIELIEDVRDALNPNSPSNAMDSVMEKIAEIIRDAKSAFQKFLQKTEKLGSIQFLATLELEFVGGMVLEAGISIDVRQILYFLSHDFNWDPHATSLASFHVAYAFDLGVQGGMDAGLSIAYHTEAVTAVNGFGWGISIEGAYGYGIGLNVGWALPLSDGIPNQYIAQIVGAGAKLEASAFINHAIIVGFYNTDLGFMLATPSLLAAKISGHPSLYYSKYAWNDMGSKLFQPSAQHYWYNLGWRECSWDFDSCSPPSSSTKAWNSLTSSEKFNAEKLGYDQKTWDAPVAIDGWYYNKPYEQYFKAYFDWADFLPFERDLFMCLGWNSKVWHGNHSPAAWRVGWNSLSPSMKTCAATIGYNEAKWNSKPVLAYPTTCDKSGKWYMPLNMAGQGRTVGTKEQCQQRCKNTSGCNYFNNFPNGGCHITTGAEGTKYDANNPTRQSGDKYCVIASDHNAQLCHPGSNLIDTSWCELQKWAEESKATRIMNLSTAISTKCLNRSYEVAFNSVIKNGSHFFLTAFPSTKENISTPECPSLAFASINGEKVVYSMDDTQVLKTSTQSHWLGNTSFKNIIEAEASVEAVHGSKLDLTKNSCIHYAGSIWRAIGFEETTELANFLIDSLLREDGLLSVARQNTDIGGLAILSRYAMGTKKFEQFVKDTVLSQLHIKD